MEARREKYIPGMEERQMNEKCGRKLRRKEITWIDLGISESVMLKPN